MAWKAAVALSLWLGSLAGFTHKAGVENATANMATASVAVYAAESVDSLRVDVEKMKRRLAVLEKAAGGDRLAEAREQIARPHSRKQRSWWQRLTGQGG